MWGLELPYRRYSVPETVMRKFRLRQSSSSSSEGLSRKNVRRPAARGRHAGRNKCSNKSNKGVQTSPHFNNDNVSHDKDTCLLHSRHQRILRRTSSVPELSSDAEGKGNNHRPSSASDRVIEVYNKNTCNGPPVIVSPGGTPTPSNYGSTFHRCDVYSNTWSYTTSSECTLGQTVSDRTTSTQDSTLSIKSSTPDSANNSDRATQRMFIENSIFSPAGNFIAVHTESLLIQPIEIIERRENWNFAFSDSPESVALPSCSRTVGVNTEPPELCAAPMVDKSTCAYGMFNDKSAQVKASDIESELMIDKSTYIEMSNIELKKSNGYMENRVFCDQDLEKSSTFSIGTNTEQIQEFLNEEQILEKRKNVEIGEHHDLVKKATNLANRRAIFNIPHIQIYKGSTTDSQNIEEKTNITESTKVFVTKYTSTDEHTFRNAVEASELQENRNKVSGDLGIEDNKIINKYEAKVHWQKQPNRAFEMQTRKNLYADVACSGCNYKDYPSVDGVIARFSAIPRSNSMLVNTSSVDYSSDSDLSLTDSLEDCTDHRADNYPRPDTRHDNRLVRGEVSLDNQLNSGRKQAKDNKTYAYFLSITGEEDMVKHYSLPDWLKVRLQRREEEIKKLFQVKLNKHQTIVYRRRKKTIKKISENDESNSAANKEENNQRRHVTSAKQGKEFKKVKKSNGQENVEIEDTTTTVSKNDNQNKEVSVIKNEDNGDANFMERNKNLEVKTDGKEQNVSKSNNCVHISEVIKIEMLNNLNTVITKEKQIDLNQNPSMHDGSNIQSSEFITNENSSNSQKVILETNIGNIQLSKNYIASELQKESDNLLSSTKNTDGTDQIISKVEESGVISSKDSSENEVQADSLITKDESEPYSFKQFKPLFQSKADDETVAQILLAAMENNNRSAKTENEEVVKTEKTETKINLNKPEAVGSEQLLQSHKNLNEVCLPSVKVERSSNTITPYLSAFVQTNESFLKEKNISKTDSKSKEIDKINNNEPSKIEIGCETEPSAINVEKNLMTSSLVQTTESFSKNDSAFIESESLVRSRDQGVDVFRESPQFIEVDPNRDINSVISVFVQTEQNAATINEVKPLIIHNKQEDVKGVIENDEREIKNLTSNRKLNINTDRNRRPVSDMRKQYSKNEVCTPHEHKSSQILELNVPPCSCHMCTLQKKTTSRLDKQNEGVQISSGVKQRESKKTQADHKEEKKSYQRYSGSRRINNMTNKFQRRFEVIPEERNSSGESIGEIKITPLDLSQEKELANTNYMSKEGDCYAKNKLESNIFEEEQLIEYRDNMGRDKIVGLEAKGTQTTGGKKSNVVFGKFKAIKNDSKLNKDARLLGEGIEVIEQYKGRAALAAAPVDSQEQLLTLSKGWINFYLLKDNQEFSDSNNDEGTIHHFQNENLVQRGVSPIKILKGSEIKEEQIEEFTVEIRATPEPIQSVDKSILPNLHQNDVIKKRKSIKAEIQSKTVCLPEIHTSSNSSTPENLNDKIVPVETKTKKYHSLPVVKGRRKSSRHEIRMQRQSVTAFEKVPKPEPLIRLAEDFASGLDKSHASKAVEVALSEHSVSSITSSTLILSEESPSPKLERKSRHRQQSSYQIQQVADTQYDRSSWTVTVAGTSGNHNHSPPDVEMRLTFGKKQNSINEYEENEKALVHFSGKKSSQVASTSKRKGRMIEQYAYSARNEKPSIQYMSGIVSQNPQNPKGELTSGINQNEITSYFDQDNSSQFSRRSKGSGDGSSELASLCSDLQVTGLAITPECKPRVPTQSERDLVRRQRYKFTR